MWNAHSGDLLRSIWTGDATCIAFLLDPAAGGRLVSASNESLVTWNVDTGERPGMLNVPSERGRYNNSVVTISPDGSGFAAAPDGAIMIWDTATRRRLQTIQGYDQDVRSLAISPDGRQIASMGKWGLRLYRATSADGDVLRAARDHPDKINAIRFSAGGGNMTMVSASASMMNVRGPRGGDAFLARDPSRGYSRHGPLSRRHPARVPVQLPGRGALGHKDGPQSVDHCVPRLRCLLLARRVQGRAADVCRPDPRLGPGRGNVRPDPSAAGGGGGSAGRVRLRIRRVRARQPHSDVVRLDYPGLEDVS